ncbi:Inosine-5'-monophosphate dehydrogenase [Austwickia sp. TVS 96-490-7B]|uniref:CBS domain-containing protein n=1 Tax=Austwickia sp. TVS 96-490-7B TaxID=2830843 RepID=UPI001C55C9B4|nr:CBS domain-containing protein [Austwickia sp. TVS 96-490-7B]MBW3084004.1 Inosine-5'-monophosphate dehydrogenase [Austwickia sp. TVS 96-490-7B]
MLVREIMTAPALSVRADSDLEEGLKVLAEHRVTAIPVVDDEHRVIGILSEVDILRRAVEPDSRAHALPVAQSEPLPKTVGEIMTPDPKNTTEGTDVASLIDLFTHTSIKSLPVVRDDNQLVGIVSRSDVIRALWRDDEDLLDDLHSAFHDYGQTHWKITVDHGMVEVAGAGNATEREVAVAIARSVLGVRRVHVVEADQLA